MSQEKSTTENWLGERIRELRKERNISQEALAVKAGVAMVSLAKIEQWKISNPGFLSIWKISIALGVSVDEFIGSQKPE